MTRRIFGTTALVGVAALLVGNATGQDRSNARTTVTPRPAASESATPSPIVVAQRSRVILEDEATLASDRPGILGFVEPGEGDQVTAGQQVAGLKDAVAKAALAVAAKTAESDVDIRYAEKAAAVAVEVLRKSEQANVQNPGNVPEVQISQLRLDSERAKLQIEKAKFDRGVAELERDLKAAELETYQIIAPIDGVVTEVLKHTGEAVQQGDPILRIVRTDVVRVEGDVTIADAFRVRPGDSVKVRLDADKLGGLPKELADRVFEGKIAFVDPTAKLVSNNVRVWATVPNEGNLLRAGLPTLMEIMPSGDLPTVLREIPKSETVKADAAEPRD
jgi:multidrug efflux pump subunit AcrA (membrane-fusion protein)